MNKKMLARMEMLRKLAKSNKEDDEPGIGKALKSKKLEKVEVIAPDKKGLEKGLSKAQEILKARLGDKFKADDEEEAEEDDCANCEGEGCADCEEPVDAEEE